MSDLNLVVVSGRLTKPLELKELAGDKYLAVGSIALNRKYKDVEKTTFLDIKVWDKSGENLTKYTKKGSRVNLQGRLEQETWEKDGKNFSKIVMVVEDFQLLDKRDE
jgi:single-strand DNA-binding protein